jgi:[NiFe] hydrogenase diaphorase moiety small subunit
MSWRQSASRSTALRVQAGRPGQTILTGRQRRPAYLHSRGCATIQGPGSLRQLSRLHRAGERPAAVPACIQPPTPGAVVENDTPRVREYRRNLIEMLFVEGNHFCPFCEKSGRCELQALAYRLGITAPRHPFLWPQRDVDASHPDILLDRNRCILCGRCVRASRDLDGKSAFGFVNRGPHRAIAVNAEARLADTTMSLADRAVEICPVGSILRKRVGYNIPIGQRPYDHQPIGAEIEKRRPVGARS